MGQPHLHQRSGVRVQRAARRDGLQHLQPLAQRGHLPECPRGGLRARLQRAAPGLLLPGRVAAPGAGRRGPAGDRRREPHTGGVLQVVPAGSAEEYRSHHAERFRDRVPRPEGERTSACHTSLRPRDAMPARGRRPVQGGPCGHWHHGRPHFPGGRRVGLHQRHSSPALFPPEVLRTPGGEKLKTLKEAASCPKALKRQKASEDADVGGVLPPRGEPQTGGLDLQGSPTSRSLFSLLLVACIFTGFSEIESRGLSTPSLQAPPRPSAAPPPASRARPALPRPRPLSPGPSPPSRPRPRNAWLTEL